MSKADDRGIKSMADPNSFKELISDAYALACILGVGGYLLAMLAL